MGDQALHQHVCVGHRKPQPEVPGQHPDRQVPSGPRRHRDRIVRIRHLSVVHSLGDCHRRVGEACWGKEGVLDTSVPFGSVSFTPEALVAKSDHVNAVYAGMDNNSNFALATALKQAGVKLKAVVFPTGYEPSAVKSPAWQYLQGDYFDTGFRPFQVPDAGTEHMLSVLMKYDHYTKSQFPTFIEYESWLGADLMIKGMQGAGGTIAPAAVVKSLRSLKSYNGNGLLANPIDYSTIFGHDTPQDCGWFMKAETKGFVPVSSTPFCGTDIPGTATASAAG